LNQINSSQFNYRYGKRIHFPYSIARLIAQIKNKENLSKHFKFEKTFVFRDKVNDYIKQGKNADIILCSCYVWNWEVTVFFAKKVKEINPNCLVIFGGPQVPNNVGDFFKKYPFVDIIVHGEGEYVIENIFNAFLKDKNYFNIKGIETKDFKTDPQPRTNDLQQFTSPYLTNLVWDLVERVDGLEWIASWETNRGCPYQCTFCDWGSATNTKMKNFSEELLFKEIEWFADNKIPYIDCCDANFGIYQDRDLRLAIKVKEESLKKNYPQTFRPAWAKFSSDKIIPIAKELQAAGLLRAVTLALQSLDETTLDIIKRQNMKFKEFSELTATFREHNIPTYTELILGLPGETLESYKKGLEIVMKDTKILAIMIYNCGIFPNAPMNEPSYREYYKIKTIHSPIYLQHSSIHDRGMNEYEFITTSTSTFTLSDLKEMYLFSWCTQTFHSLGIFEYLSKYYNKIHGLTYIKFYETFLDFCRTNQSIFSDEYKKVVINMNNGYSGKGWNHYDPNLGDIYWPIEEATWLRLASDEKKLLDGIDIFLQHLEVKQGYNTPQKILKDLAKFQVFLLSTKTNQNEIKSENFEFNWKNFFGNDSELKSSNKKYNYNNLIIEKDPIQWAYKAVWYGRFEKLYKIHPESLQEELKTVS